jgi:hypothetical protein
MEKREPFRKTLSPNVEVYYGYKDGHALIRARTPVGLWIPQEIPCQTILGLKKAFADAFEYGLKPESERRLEKPVEIVPHPNCRCRWGYKDGHVELDLWKVVWFTLAFPFEEFRLAKAAMDEVVAWAELPDYVRELQGVAT